MIRAIVVDDEPSLLEIAKRFLEKQGGFEIDTASTAQEAFTLLKGGVYDAVVSDYRMSDMDGLQFLKTLRDRGNEIPFILFTGHGREEVAMVALNSGADFYLQKQGDPRTQFAELKNMMTVSVQRREADVKLRVSEENYRHLLESSPALICRLSPTGEIIFVNSIVREYTEYDVDSLKGANWWEVFYPGELGQQVHRLYSDFFDVGLDIKNLKMRLRDKNDTIHTLLWNSSNVWDQDTGELLEINGAAIDATRRIEMQEHLRRSEEFNRAVLNSLDANIAVLDSRGDIVTVNEAWREFRDANGGTLPKSDKRENYLDICERAEGDRSEGASEALEGIRATLRGDMHAFSMEYPCHTPNTKRWFLMTVSPLSKGELGAVVAHVDNTSRKQMEEALVQTNRKLSLLNSITRHDMINHLTALQGNLELAMMNARGGKEIDAMGKAMDSVGMVLRHLEFSREYQSMGERSPEWVDAQAACESAVSEINTAGVSVNMDLEGLRLFADPMLEKVFHNLVSNALKHGETTTRVDLRFDIRGEEAVVICEDDGEGIRWDLKGDIFEREHGSPGGGYGLYLAREILNITDITIAETGTPGEGARFEITAPSGVYRLE